MRKVAHIPILYLIFTCGYTHAVTQQTVITGNAPSYANSQLVFMRPADLITQSEEVVATCHVLENGDFSLEVPLKTTERLYVHLGIYSGYFLVEPGKTYQIVLPEYTEKSTEEQLNPYFEPVELHLGLINFDQNDLNMLTVMFDDAYLPYYNKHVNNIYAKSDMKKIEEDIQQIEKPFQEFSKGFFYEFRRYRYGTLKLLANQQGVQSLSDEYFNNQPVLYNNPAYTDLFNHVYDKYFVFFGRAQKGKEIYTIINQTGSYKALLKLLSESANFTNDTLKELVILKQIHDEYYGNQFSRSGLLAILDSLLAYSHIETHKQIGLNIKQKITRLQPGFKPPQFELQDTDGKLIKLDDFKGKYVYLNFCTCQSYACLNEFNLLSTLNQRFRNILVILTIATDPKEEILKQFLLKNKYDWKFLHYDKQPSVIKEYDIRAFPTYFLIGPDGKLIFSPALSPAENFEAKLLEILKARGDL
jgi:peroxiredoxin